nr:2-oxoglutarate dehydrogenase, E2 component, dihydrolipoamide succinyltransferase [Microbacterium testaceum]
MSTSVVLPALGESVTEGTVTRWLKQVGDTVQEDEGLLEISTDKVDTEIPSPISGVIEEILVQEDETVEVGAVLAKIGDGSGAASSDDAPQAAPAEQESEPAQEAAPAEAAPTEQVAPAEQSAPAAGGDSTEVKLPELGESVTEGTVTRWLKAVGDDVAVDEPLLEISTDKVDTEIPSPVAGTLQEILVQEDETVNVGAALARIGSGAAPAAQPEAPAPAAEEEPAAPAAEEKPAAPAAEEKPAAPAAEEKPAAPAAEEKPAAPAAEEKPAASSSNDDITYVTPLVRRLAQQQGVDLASVTGSGVGGRIRKEDVLKAAEAAKVAPAASSAPAAAAPAAAPAPVEVSPLRGTTQKMSRLRKVIAERAVASMQATAQLTTVVEVDVTKVAALRDRVKGEFQQKTGDKLSFLPFFAIAAIEALKTYPIINSTVEGDEIVYPAQENIAIAVDTERGLLTPVIKEAGDKNIAQLAREIADLAARTRDNKLKPDELAGGTFTLTNTGSRGALFDTPIVFLPQSAILGLGAVVKKPGVVSVDGKDAISVRSYVYLALSYDHRTIDGADAARFLGAVKARLEAAQFEGDLGY